MTVAQCQLGLRHINPYKQQVSGHEAFSLSEPDLVGYGLGRPGQLFGFGEQWDVTTRAHPRSRPTRGLSICHVRSGFHSYDSLFSSKIQG